MYRSRKLILVVIMGIITSLLISSIVLAAQGDVWTSAGGNRANTRYQKAEHTLSVDNIGSLTPKWVLTTGGDVSATPAVDDDTVYFPDWDGNLYAVDKLTGAVKWQVSIAAATGVPGDKARSTPAVTEDKVVIGTQGSILFGGGPGGKVLAFNKFTGALVWTTIADLHPAAIITQSAIVFDGVVYVGVASLEEFLAIVPGYVLSFRGSMLALDLDTGDILWKTYTAPEGFTGNAVWGSSPAIDTKRGQVYIATGNNYSVPQEVIDCVDQANGDPDATAACLPAENHFDSVLALDMMTGMIRWAKRAIPYDAWTVDCIPFFGDGSNCPEPAGPDYDFGQMPALFSVKFSGMGKPTDVVGVGQKSGQYWVLDADTGATIWVTQAGPGGTAGGLQWGSAVDGQRVYTANANSNFIPWDLPDGTTTTDGVLSGLDAINGNVLWQVTPPHGGSTSGPVTTANGLVFGCSLDPNGYMYALDAATGDVLWEFLSGGSCLSGAAISDGMLFWGSGYSNFGFGTPNNKLYAFGLP